MNWLDLVLLFILAVSVATSFRKGLSREVVGLVSVVLALLVGSWFYGSVSAMLQPYLSSRAIANFAAFFIVFCCVLMLGSVVSFAIGKFLRVTGLSFVDHALGAVFGILRGVLISVALIMGMMAFRSEDQPPASVVHSRMAPYVVDAARVVAGVAPHELREGFHKTYGQVKSAWNKALEEGRHRLPAGKGNDEGKI
jgi:membrane protein required for colicin V production